MSIMIFIFLCFSGLFVMFFFILRNQEKMQAHLLEELAQHRSQLRLVEARLATLLGEEEPVAKFSEQNQAPAPLTLDSLDSLSMGNEPEQKQAGGLDLHFDTNEHFRR